MNENTEKQPEENALSKTEAQPPVKERKPSAAERRRIEAVRAKQMDSGERLFKTPKIFNETDPGMFLKEDLPKEDAWDDSAGRLSEATGLEGYSAGTTFLFRMAIPLQRTNGERYYTTLNEFGDYLKEFKPKDAIEGSLAAQAIVCQEKGMDLLSSANKQQHPKWAQIQFNAAFKLLGKSQNALQALISYRRGGEQRVVVQHVQVNDGGKAIVGGNMAMGGGANQENSARTL